MTRNAKLCTVAVLAACTLVLAGCFGGSDGDGDDGGPGNAGGPLDGVPASASADSAGFVAYLRSLVALQPEDREPVGIEAVTPPTPEGTEPEPLG
ncbi:MAG: hypothetical protein ACK4PH_21180 [Aquincola tertiaricarbonis]|uniref:hypothetical protein n=1 Tax=Aquincola TaxID=391952 RepID=UPI0006152703|nr:MULTISPECIES: hypothetical protein [Aquincola]MCR5865086.1 hypothetical protein [Aquincola sp. J276]